VLRVVMDRQSGDALALGKTVAARLLEQGAARLLESVMPGAVS
jgi:hypothetical protein